MGPPTWRWTTDSGGRDQREGDEWRGRRATRGWRHRGDGWVRDRGGGSFRLVTGDVFAPIAQLLVDRLCPIGEPTVVDL